MMAPMLTQVIVVSCLSSYSHNRKFFDAHFLSLSLDKNYEKVYETAPQGSYGRQANGGVVTLGNNGEHRGKKRKELCATTVVILTSIAALVLCVRVLVMSPFQLEKHAGPRSGEPEGRYLFDENGKCASK